MNNDKVMFARVLNLDYLNSFDQNGFDLSENDVTKNINNLIVTMEDNKVHLRWNDCVNPALKKVYVLKAENSIPTSVYSGNIIESYTEKNKYSTIDLIDDQVTENVLYCYRVFYEFNNDSKYYSGFKNIFYVYVTGATVCTEEHDNGPVFSKDVITDPLNRFVSESQIQLWTNKSDFDGNYNNLLNKPILSNVATTGNYNDLTNKPVLKPVATSGNYNDLINKPSVYQKSEVYTKSETYNKTEIGNLIKTSNKFSGNYNDLTNKPNFSTVATTGSYNDLADKPSLSTIATTGDYEDLTNAPDVYQKSETYNKTEIDDLMSASSNFTGSYNDLTDKPDFAKVATSGSYNDLTSKPDVYKKSEVYRKSEVYAKTEAYNKTEVNDLIEEVKTKIPTDIAGVYRYVPEGAQNGECQIVATKKGITFSKTNNKAVLTIPAGAEILSIQVKFSGSEVGTNGKVIIRYGENYNFENNMFIPTYSVLQDTEGNRSYKSAQAATFGTNPNEIQLVGLSANIGVIAKLTF